MTFSVNGRGHQVLQALRHDGWSHDDLITPRITFTGRAGEVAKNPSPVAG
jgi:hypothetical protein